MKLPSSAFVKDLVKRTKLIQHYEKAWTGWDGPLTFTYESKEKDDAFHPSGDCTPTSEALYLKAIAKMAGEEPDPIGPTLRKTFLVGHFWHQVYQDLTVRELGFAKPEHVERTAQSCWGHYGGCDVGLQSLIDPKPHNHCYPPYHWARGSADIAPCEIPGHGPYLIDFKTMNSRDFGRADAGKGPPDWAVDKWECQLNIYMDWFNLDRALIVGINKDSPHNLVEFEFHHNPELVEAIYEKWQNVTQCIKDGVRPIADEDPPLPLMGPVTT